MQSLPPHEVHLWCVMEADLEDEALIRTYEGALSDAELTRAARFHKPHDRHRFVIGRGLLRSVLGHELAIDARDVELSTNRYGRPELATFAAPRFNVSHTDAIVVVAVGAIGALGVDAERVRVEFPHLEVARRQFSPAIYAALERLSPQQQSTRFCDYWVLLEAYAKATGLGLSLPLANVRFAFDACEPAAIRFAAPETTRADPWRFWLLAPCNDHRLAVAASGPGDRLVVHRMRARRSEIVELPLLASGENQHGSHA
jgi:4'-phosphopantetheinyl transferase